MAFDPNSPATGHNIHSDVTATRTNFNALRSCESSATEPSNLVAGMFWYDTTANLLKLRNEANTAWQNIWDFGNNRVGAAGVGTTSLQDNILTADTGGRAKMADLFVTNAKVNDVAGSKITGTMPVASIPDGAISTAAKIDNNIIPGAKESKTIVGNSSQALTGTQTWTPPAGFYSFWSDMLGPPISFQVYMSGAWRSITVLANNTFFMWCDGTNMKFVATAGPDTTTIYYITR